MPAASATTPSMSLPSLDDALAFLRTLGTSEQKRDFCEEALRYADSIGADVAYHISEDRLRGVRVSRAARPFMWCYPKGGRIQLYTRPQALPPGVEATERGIAI